jgi:hypothetical protein
VGYAQNRCSFIGVLQEKVGKHCGGIIWKVFCIMQSICRERNTRKFEGFRITILTLKFPFVCSLFDWTLTTSCFSHQIWGVLGSSEFQMLHFHIWVFSLVLHVLGLHPYTFHVLGLRKNTLIKASKRCFHCLCSFLFLRAGEAG